MSAPRSLKLNTPQDVIDEIARLRRGHRKLGNWSLAQICWHVSVPVEKYLSPPEPMDVAPTPEQAQKKAAFVDYIVEHKKPPPYIKDAPPHMVPPETAGDADIDRYLRQLDRLQKYPHPKVMMGPVGPVTIDEFRACNVFHAIHHLSFLEPTASRRTGLRFATPDDAIADVRRLQRGYAKAGNWSLEQVCWHLDRTARARLAPGPYAPNTPEQEARVPLFAKIAETGQLPPNLVAPDGFVPPADADAPAIESYVEALELVKNHKGPFAPHRLFGHMSDELSRKQILIHAAHHLGHLVPMATTPRENLKYETVQDLIADVERLRRGHQSAGQWTLPQAAWHIGLALRNCLQPLSSDAAPTPEQKALKERRLDPMFRAGVMPRGLPAGQGLDPIKDAKGPLGDAEIDRLIDGLRQLETFPHDRVPFGPFGIITTDEFRQFMLIHAANHLSNFIPTT